MASHIHAAAAGDLPLTGMHDLRLRPRLLRRVLAECLPLPDPAADLQPTRSPADLARALSAVREQGLLAVEGAADPGLLEEWSAAVDAWVDRLVALLASDREHSCWVGTSFLGLTFEECSEDRFANSYSFWFEKIMKKIKVPSSNKMDEATLLAQKVVQPLLRLLDKDGSVAEKATDLLGLIMKLFPSSVYRHFNKKLASTLALLPCVRVSHNSLSLMIQKILIVVNNLLNGYTGFELMPLISPGSKPPPLSGGQTTYGDWNFHSAKKFCTFAVPTISALIHCCSMMLTTSYPIQVNIPVPAVVTFIQRVLLTDVTFHKSSLVQQDTPSCHLSFSEILELHSSFLDFLGAIIKGMRSSLLPHAGSVVTLITEYFKGAKLPAVRRKLYTIVRLLMSSMGVERGLDLFNKGRLETGTELAKFCSHALLALDVLVHPREHCLQYDPKIPLRRAAHGDQGSLSIASDNEVLDSGRCKNLHSACKNQATENSGDEVNEWLFSTDDAPIDAFVEDNTAENHEVKEMSRDHLVQKDTVIGEHQEIVLNKFHGELLVPTSSRTDADVAIAGTKGGTYNSPADYMDLGGATFSNNKDDQHGRTISGAASSSQNVARHTAPICDASGLSGTEWDSLDPFLDIGNFGTETTFSLDMANLDPGSN
uniref:Pre-rRNA-processing protein RIX1 N-terminal domain-containing protein n=1 Tax=Oryza rufipogon TaxID=4529 RepID=A0A0E0PXI2_ORYRU